ncbi:MAG: hypothetical protein K5675_10700 [Lachnospiraceae bacterium]|nr:hypothetical protein [Lachnospiraceae bacterium]
MKQKLKLGIFLTLLITLVMGITVFAATIPKGSTGNKKATATWSPINYTITYNLGGSASNPTR